MPSAALPDSGKKTVSGPQVFGNLRLRYADARSGATLSGDGTAITWEQPVGRHVFTAEMAG
jgi:hypothetical protein